MTGDRHIRIEPVWRDDPDVRKLALAFIALAEDLADPVSNTLDTDDDAEPVCADEHTEDTD